MSIPLVPSLLRAHLAELAAEDRGTTVVTDSKVAMWSLKSIAYLEQKGPLELGWEILSF